MNEVLLYLNPIVALAIFFIILNVNCNWYTKLGVAVLTLTLFFTVFINTELEYMFISYKEHLDWMVKDFGTLLLLIGLIKHYEED